MESLLKQALEEGVGAVVRTDVLVVSQREMPTSKGGVLVVMEERDETGFTIDFVSFKSQPDMKGVVVYITGTVNEYQGKINFILKGGVPSSKDPADFMFKSGGEKYWNLLMEKVYLIEHDELHEAAWAYLMKFKEQLILAAGAATMHHNYAGGLTQHLYEVVLYAEGICKSARMLGRVNVPVVLFSCIVHDHGKLFVYDVDQFTGGSDGNEYGKFSDHLVPTITMLHDVFSDIPHFNEIVHCVLAHHGKLEWGALKEPSSMEAFIVHTADLLSTNHTYFLNAAETTDSGWTKDKVFPLNRRLFITKKYL